MRTYKSPDIHRTPLYRAKAAYYGMEARCLNRNGKNPTYANVELKISRDEWLAWAVPQYELFAGKFPDQTPNAARSGDQGHYELGNIRIVPFIQNYMEQSGKGEYQSCDGHKKCSHCKRVLGIEEFYNNKSRRDGLATDCRDCMREHHKNRNMRLSRS